MIVSECNVEGGISCGANNGCSSHRLHNACKQHMLVLNMSVLTLCCPVIYCFQSILLAGMTQSQRQRIPRVQHIILIHLCTHLRVHTVQNTLTQCCNRTSFLTQRMVNCRDDVESAAAHLNGCSGDRSHITSYACVSTSVLTPCCPVTYH